MSAPVDLGAAVGTAVEPPKARPPQTVEAAAKQFEALMIEQLLKEARGDEELLDVREAILPRAMVVVVNKRHQDKTQWHHYIRGGRLQPWNQSQKIAEQNEQEERGQITNEPLISVPDNLLSLVRHKLVCHLGEVLHSSRLLDTQRHPHQDEVGDKHQKHQQLHRKCLGDRSLRIVGPDVDRVQHLRRQVAEVFVHRSSDGI